MHNYMGSSIMENVHADIRGELLVEALRMEKNGDKVLKLNVGNPGAFGFGMPDDISRVLCENIDNFAPYCDYKGLPSAREAIYNYHSAHGIHNFDVDDILVTNGVSEGISMLTTSTVDKGDEVLLPSPCYPLWTNCVRIAGGVPVFYKCDEDNGWNPDVRDIENKITDKTKAILIINPNNPTGAVYSEDILLKITELAREHGLMIFSDEIYDRLLFDGAKHIPTASLCDDILIITANGLSKSHTICGMRCGWLVASGPEKMRKDFCQCIGKLAAIRLCANSAMQYAIPAALLDNSCPEAMTAPEGKLGKRRASAVRAIGNAKNITAVVNSAAFYIFAKFDKAAHNITNDIQMCMDLLHDKKILVMPGSYFNFGSNDHFRIVLLPDVDDIANAIARIDEFLNDYVQK